MAVIIWGSGSFNRHNVETRRATCEHCGFTGPLKSYDATSFFSLYFIPLLPTGRRHVIDECPKCKRGRQTSAGKWSKLRRDELEPALDRFAAAPADREAARRALELATRLAGRVAFADVAQAVAEHHAQDASLLAQVGAACGYRELPEDALTAYQSSLAVVDDPEVRGALAMELMHQDRPRDAEAHVIQVVKAQGDDAAGLLYLLAESYQTVGEHGKALSAIDAYEKRFPELASGHAGELNRLRSGSDRMRHSGARITSANLAAGKAAAAPESMLRRVGPMLVLPALILAVALGFAAISLTMKPEVYMINGLTREMAVTVGGRKMVMQPMSREKLTLGYGDVRIEPGAGVYFEPATVSLSAGFFERVFDKPIYVINPDRTGLVLWESAQYAKNPATAAEGKYEIHTGKPVVRLTGLDYHWRDLPEEIELSSDSAKPWRQTVHHLDNYMFADAVDLVHEELGEAEAAQYVKLRAAATPDDELVLRYLHYYLNQADHLAFLEERVGQRPVLTALHRSYQALAGALQPERDLAAEYRARYEAEPGDASLAYLAGRMEKDPAKAMTLYEAGLAADEPSAYLYHGVAYRRMQAGDFEQALSLWRKAVAMELENELFADSLDRMLMATGRLGELIQEAELVVAGDPESAAAVYDLVKLLAMKGEVDTARAQSGQMLRRLQNMEDADDDTRAYWRKTFAIVIAQASQDAAGVAAKIKLVGAQDEWPYTLAAIDGRWGDALKHLEGSEYGEAAGYLAIYAGAAHSGQDTVAAPALDAAVKLLRERGDDDQLLADWLEGKQTPPPDANLYINENPDDLGVRLTALAMRYPEHREAWLGLARKLLFDPAGYKHELEAVIQAAADASKVIPHDAAQ